MTLILMEAISCDKEIALEIVPYEQPFKMRVHYGFLLLLY